MEKSKPWYTDEFYDRFNYKAFVCGNGHRDCVFVVKYADGSSEIINCKFKELADILRPRANDVTSFDEL